MNWRSLAPGLLVFALLVLLAACVTWQKSPLGYSVLSTDGRGYYAYLPSLLIYGETDFQSSYAAETAQLVNWKTQNYLQTNDAGKTFNKYFPGVAALVLPFLLVAWLLGALFLPEVTGYEDLFMIAFHLATLAYTTIGFELLRRMAFKISGRFSMALFTALLVVFGTNLFYYAAFVPSLSHCYSFFAITWMLYLAFRLREKLTVKNMTWLIISCALVFLIRPTNCLAFLLIPVMVGSKEAFVRVLTLLRNHWIRFLIVVLLAFAPLFILNWIQTDSIWLWSYAGEGFYFSQPRLLDVLFSIRKGWWIWTPVALVALFGLLKLSRWSLIWSGVFMVLAIYFVASWWNWYYGGGFGHRAFVDIYGFIGVLLVILLTQSNVLWKRVLISLLFFLGLFNVLQAYQTTVGILPKDFINASIYQRALTMYHPSDADLFSGLDDIRPFGKIVKHEAFEISQQEKQVRSEDEFPSGKLIQLGAKETPTRYFFHTSIDVRKDEPCENLDDVMLILEFRNERDSLVDYQHIPLYNYRKHAVGKWDHLEFNVESGRENAHTVKIYIWNKAGCSFTIRAFGGFYEEINPT